MTSNEITNALLAMGLNPNASVPLANAENLQLLKEVEELTEEKKNTKLSWEQTNLRYEKLLEHQSLTNTLINQNLRLLEAYQSDVRRELNLLKLRKRVSSKLSTDIKNMDCQYKDHKKYMATTEKELCKRNQHIDEMTSRMKWAKVALIEWEEAVEAGENGLVLIEKYFKQDNVRAIQQEQEREVISNDISKTRQLLINIYDEQKTLEQNLERTAVLYRAAHSDRRQMVQTWKQAVQTMMERENGIVQNEEYLMQTKDKANMKARELKNFNDKLNGIILGNRETEKNIEEVNKESSEIKQQMQILSDMIILKENDVDLMQKELTNISSRVQQQRYENRENVKNKQKKQDDLDNLLKLIEQLRERSNIIHDKNLSAQVRLNELEKMADAEEKSQAQINANSIRINNLLYKTQQNVVEFKDESKVLELSVYGVKQAVNALKRNFKSMEEELKRKTELHYDISFKCLEMERHITRLQGGVIDPEEEANNIRRLSKLEEEHAKVQRRLITTEGQNKKLDDSMRNLVDFLNADSKRIMDMKFQVKESTSYCEGGIKQLKVQTENNRTAIVELNILKMRVKDFEQELENRDNNSYNLQKHRLHLNRTIKDRLINIKSQMDLLKLKSNHLKDEKGMLRADIGERNKQIEAMRARFELSIKLLGTNPNGTLITATQLRVEAAQEKQLVLEEGNALNKRVISAEMEIKALENSLLLMNTANDKFRSTCGQLKDAEAVEELNKLKSHFCESLNGLRTLQCKLLKLEQDYDNASGLKIKLEAHLKQENSKRFELMEILDKLKKEIENQESKFDRAKKDYKRNLKALKQRAISKDMLSLFSQKFDIRDLEERNAKALNQLTDIIDSDENMGPQIIKALGKKGLELPHALNKYRSSLSIISGRSTQAFSMTSQGSSFDDSTSEIFNPSSARLSIVSIDFPTKQPQDRANKNLL